MLYSAGLPLRISARKASLNPASVRLTGGAASATAATSDATAGGDGRLKLAATAATAFAAAATTPEPPDGDGFVTLGAALDDVRLTAFAKASAVEKPDATTGPDATETGATEA